VLRTLSRSTVKLELMFLVEQIIQFQSMAEKSDNSGMVPGVSRSAVLHSGCKSEIQSPLDEAADIDSGSEELSRSATTHTGVKSEIVTTLNESSINPSMVNTEYVLMIDSAAHLILGGLCIIEAMLGGWRNSSTDKYYEEVSENYLRELRAERKRVQEKTSRDQREEARRTAEKRVQELERAVEKEKAKSAQHEEAREIDCFPCHHSHEEVNCQIQELEDLGKILRDTKPKEDSIEEIRTPVVPVVQSEAPKKSRKSWLQRILKVLPILGLEKLKKLFGKEVKRVD